MIWLRPGRWAAALALLAGGMLLGFWSALPLAALESRLQALATRQGVALEHTPLRRAFPPALIVTRLQLRGPALGAGVTVEELRLAPDWGGLLRGAPGLRLAARLGGAPVRGRLDLQGAYQLEWQGTHWRGTLAAPPFTRPTRIDKSPAND